MPEQVPTVRVKQVQSEGHGQAMMYTLLVPIPGNDKKFQQELLTWVQDHLVQQFGGVTTLAESQGLWVAPSGAVYTNQHWPVQCVVAASDGVDRWFRSLSAEIASVAGCQEVFLLKQPVTALHRS